MDSRAELCRAIVPEKDLNLQPAGVEWCGRAAHGRVVSSKCCTCAIPVKGRDGVLKSLNPHDLVGYPFSEARCAVS